MDCPSHKIQQKLAWPLLKEHSCGPILDNFWDIFAHFLCDTPKIKVKALSSLKLLEILCSPLNILNMNYTPTKNILFKNEETPRGKFNFLLAVLRPWHFSFNPSSCTFLICCNKASNKIKREIWIWNILSAKKFCVYLHEIAVLQVNYNITENLVITITVP